jgi:hypothetical protein
MRAVFEVPGVTFYTLQVGAASAELHTDGGSIRDLSSILTDWTATAAIVSQLDLVISVDTSVAHLGGALGRPVWICLDVVPEWRWMLERTDTPWYGSARLFRQQRVGDRGAVLADVAAALERLVQERSRRSA